MSGTRSSLDRLVGQVHARRAAHWRQLSSDIPPPRFSSSTKTIPASCSPTRVAGAGVIVHPLATARAPLSFYPLATLDTLADRVWAQEWLEVPSPFKAFTRLLGQLAKPSIRALELLGGRARHGPLTDLREHPARPPTPRRFEITTRSPAGSAGCSTRKTDSLGAGPFQVFEIGHSHEPGRKRTWSRSSCTSSTASSGGCRKSALASSSSRRRGSLRSIPCSARRLKSGSARSGRRTPPWFSSARVSPTWWGHPARHHPRVVSDKVFLPEP